MSIARVAVTGLAVALVGCGTVEDYAWLGGVSSQNAHAIRDQILKSTPAKRIYYYEPDADGSIIISTDDGAYQARRVGNKWVITKPVIITGSNQAIQLTADRRVTTSKFDERVLDVD